MPSGPVPRHLPARPRMLPSYLCDLARLQVRAACPAPTAPLEACRCGRARMVLWHTGGAGCHRGRSRGTFRRALGRCLRTCLISRASKFVPRARPRQHPLRHVVAAELGWCCGTPGERGCHRGRSRGTFRRALGCCLRTCVISRASKFVPRARPRQHPLRHVALAEGAVLCSALLCSALRCCRAQGRCTPGAVARTWRRAGAVGARLQPDGAPEGAAGAGVQRPPPAPWIDAAGPCWLDLPAHLGWSSLEGPGIRGWGRAVVAASQSVVCSRP